MNNELLYLDALSTVLKRGVESGDRTGTGTLRYPGIQMRFDLQHGFPAVTTKKLAFYPMLVELLWFMQGDIHTGWLKDRKCNIWNEWEVGKTIGLGYGHQWRKAFCNDLNGNTKPVDQLKEAVEMIKSNPESRRILIDSWNPVDLQQMALPPCHFAFQFVVVNGRLNCILSQRSGDMFLGVPFNIASYAALTHMIAIECDLLPGELIHTIGDAHVYLNHLDQANTQLSRAPFEKPPEIIFDDSLFENGLMNWVDNVLPDLSIGEIKNLIKLEGYESHPAIKAPVAI